ncbi:hypothetical protein BC938DRAFT_482923 [Jimgerdemannia flammicorona]|uniref:DNA mismatch repair proteins mutS family domain-containing protein n=1 Tax=Jimgerdemannia flammicorona TaxID=994334 RepID=A0A433QD25_9FUNG|nr:hypothetical protein BC938DRAFT_482923 [Jimgerdemannia flammicorona]
MVGIHFLRNPLPRAHHKTSLMPQRGQLAFASRGGNKNQLIFILIISKDEQDSKIRYLYTVKDGNTAEEHYGMKLAEMVGLPLEIVDRASAVAKQVGYRILRIWASLNSGGFGNEDSPAIQEYEGNTATKGAINWAVIAIPLQLGQQLHDVRKNVNNMSETYLREYLKLLQDEFLETMQKIK